MWVLTWEFEQKHVYAGHSNEGKAVYPADGTEVIKIDRHIAGTACVIFSITKLHWVFHWFRLFYFRYGLRVIVMSLNAGKLRCFAIG